MSKLLYRQPNTLHAVPDATRLVAYCQRVWGLTKSRYGDPATDVGRANSYRLLGKWFSSWRKRVGRVYVCVQTSAPRRERKKKNRSRLELCVLIGWA
jgi:hypothetical protein